MAAGIPRNNELMTENDVLNYFVQNGGVVKNNDIVTYFRTYLANPSYRDEARALFKSIVNKLATVKVENGEKYLVLKRKFFPPIDGNGNNDLTGHGISSNSAPPRYPAQVAPAPAYQQQPSVPKQHNPHQIVRSPSAQSNPYPGQDYEYNQNIRPHQQQYSAPIGPIVSSNYQYPQHPSTNYLNQQQQQQYYYQQSSPHLSKSQPSLHGSNFSLSSNNTAIPGYFPNAMPGASNINNAYLNSPNSYAQQLASSAALLYGNNNTDSYPPEYGLPPVSMNNSAQRRVSFPASPPSALPNAYPQAQPSFDRQMSAPGRTPPPYRPPPPAVVGGAGSLTPPSMSSSPLAHGTRMLSPPSSNANYRNVNTPLSSHAANSPYHPQQARKQLNLQGLEPNINSTGHVHQLQRSLSGSESVTSSLSKTTGLASSPTSSYLQTTASAGEIVPAPPVPPRFKRGSSSSNSPNSEANSQKSVLTMSMEDQENNIDRSRENDKENDVPNENKRRSRSSSLPNGSDISDGSSSISAAGNGEEISEDSDQKISVKERMQKFNRIASESELGKLKNSNNVNKGKQPQDQEDNDSASLSSYGFGYTNTEPRAREWILKAATCDYHGINKLGLEVPSLAKRKDVNGYTALHWAAKHGHIELIKLLAGTLKCDINSKSNGGYTPLHLAAQFNRHDAYEILVKVYNADPNIRDHSGRKPMQYLVRQDTAVSMDTFKKIKEKRRSTENNRDSSFLRIGSLNVRVKRTTEAFGNFLGKSNSSSSIERITNKSWGSADNIPESFDNVEKDKEMMPPPPNGSVVLRGSSKSKDKNKQTRRSLQTTMTTNEISMKLQLASSSDSEESDTACGFGSNWKAT